MVNSHFFTSESRYHTPWSNSKISTLEKCPYKFNLQYIVKLKENDIPPDLKAKVDRAAAKYGSSIHRASELFAEGKKIEDALETASSEEKLTREEKRSVEAGADSIIIFERRINSFKDKYPMSLDECEIELALNDSLKPAKYSKTDAAIRGKLDRLLISEDERVAVVLDLKTSSYATLDYAGPQLDFYATLILGNYPKVEAVKSALYFTKMSKILWAPTVRRDSYSLNEDNSVVKRINGAVAEFYKTTEPEIKVHNLCKYCIYREICKKDRKIRRKRDKEAAKNA